MMIYSRFLGYLGSALDSRAQKVVFLLTKNVTGIRAVHNKSLFGIRQPATIPFWEFLRIPPPPPLPWGGSRPPTQFGGGDPAFAFLFFSREFGGRDPLLLCFSGQFGGRDPAFLLFSREFGGLDLAFLFFFFSLPGQSLMNPILSSSYTVKNISGFPIPRAGKTGYLFSQWFMNRAVCSAMLTYVGHLESPNC